jgi:hypothetical protein
MPTSVPDRPNIWEARDVKRKHLIEPEQLMLRPVNSYGEVTERRQY